MKKIITNQIILLTLISANACKKNNPVSTTPSKYENTPTCAYPSYELIGGNVHYFISIFDRQYGCFRLLA